MDRILSIVQKLSSEKFNKEVVEKALVFLEIHSGKETVDYLVNDIGIIRTDAIELVSSINKEWIIVNQHAVRLSVVFFFLFAFVLIGGIALNKTGFILTGGSGALLQVYSTMQKNKEIKRLKSNFIL